jgi:hypothetical protein
MAEIVLTPPPSIAHTCRGAMDCGADAPGHAIGFLQQRLASASPSKWVDAVVEHVGHDGWVGLRGLDEQAIARVWNHAELGALEPGTPVALHALYNVLAVGAARFNVVVAAS